MPAGGDVDPTATFLLGLIIGRRRILQEAGRHRRALAIVAGVGLLGAVAGNVVERVLDSGPGLLGGLAWAVGNYGVTAFYGMGWQEPPTTLSASRWWRRRGGARDLPRQPPMLGSRAGLPRYTASDDLLAVAITWAHVTRAKSGSRRYRSRWVTHRLSPQPSETLWKGS